MSWLIVGIRNLRYKAGLAPLLHFNGLAPNSTPHESIAQKPNRAIRSRAEGRLAYAEDRDAAIAVVLQN
jgi:hypothetical protein